MTERKPFATGPDVPPEWKQDLNPNAGAGINYGNVGPQDEIETVPAADLKAVYALYPRLTDDELRRIPILPPGTRLEQGATYLDLRTPGAEFTGRGDMQATEDHLYVAKKDVDYQLWNKLLGVEEPERTGEASD
jgi:hypothetical protein